MKQYVGSRVNLTPASRLVLSIADIDNLQLMIDGLLLQCDFRHAYVRLKADLDAKLDCCSAILNSASLRQFAHLMLQVGNILNEVDCRPQTLELHYTFCRYRTDHALTVKKSAVEIINCSDKNTDMFVAVY